MSYRALIAQEQPNDRFNVYYSHNGAEDIQLLEKLRGSLNVHGRVDFESLTGKKMPSLAQQFTEANGSKYTSQSADPERIVNPRPVAVNVEKRELLLADDLLQFEVLYVVENGEVDAYWLAWVSPDVIRPWRDHITLEVYDPEEPPTLAGELPEFFDEATPVRTISDFERGWLSDDRVRAIVRDYHRWMYELYSMTVDQDVDDISDAERILQTPEYWLVFRTDRNATLVPRSYPFIIPIRLGSPPMAASERIRETVAQTRFSIGAGLNAAETVSDDELQQARTDALIEIVDAHRGNVATQFLPEPLGESIAEYQQVREWQFQRELWKN